MARPKRIVPDPVAAAPALPVPSRSQLMLAAALILLAALVAYHNTFFVPFNLDDDGSIKNNPSIRNLWSAWWPPNEHGDTVSGRPLLNFSLALSYALSGLDVWGYHLFNFVIHTSAGLVLFGVVRRTLRQPVLARRFGRDALWLALAVALLWTVHPLQTESVTYVVQRAESLLGLIYLLTLWCFIRAIETGSARGWKPLAVACCLLGMAAKEVMVTAPVLLALYDRIFVAGSWREVWAQRRRLHLAMAGTWLLLAGLLWSAGNRGGTAGLGTISSVDYALTQIFAIARYLRLSFWPHPLVFDYGSSLRTDAASVVPAALILAPLAIASLWGVWRGRPAGYCGFFFFGVLAPSSSFVPVASQTMAEHRMYLPLAAVVALAVAVPYSIWGRKVWPVFGVFVVALAWSTIERNWDYRTSIALWEDTVKKWPEGCRAQSNLGGYLVSNPARRAEGIRHIEEAIRLAPNNAVFYINLGLALSYVPERLTEALAACEKVQKLNPRSALGHSTLATVLNKMSGGKEKALIHARKAVELNPALAAAHATLGQILSEQPEHRDEALRHMREAIRLDPIDPETLAILGMALLEIPGGRDEAIRHLAAANRIDPDNTALRTNLAFALAEVPDRYAEAVEHFRIVAEMLPGEQDARYNFGTALLRVAGRETDTIKEFEAVLQINPNDAEAHNNLGLILSRNPKRTGEAQAHFETALELKPDLADAHFNLAKLAAEEPARLPEAISQLEATLKLSPEHGDARELLAKLSGRTAQAKAGPSVLAADANEGNEVHPAAAATKIVP